MMDISTMVVSNAVGYIGLRIGTTGILAASIALSNAAVNQTEVCKPKPARCTTSGWPGCDEQVNAKGGDMIDLLREILRAVIKVIREEIAFRRFIRNLRANVPQTSKWRDAVSKMTLEQWKTRTMQIGHARLTSPAITDLEQKIKDQKAEDDRRRSLMREVNVRRSKKRPRSKFKKRWPHGKHSG